MACAKMGEGTVFRRLPEAARRFGGEALYVHHAGVDSTPWAATGAINDRHTVITNRPDWLIAIRRYLVAMTVGNLV
jgi:hypothetical protein